MLRTRKSLWIDIVKLLSFDFTKDYTQELGCEDVYSDEIKTSIRNIINPDNIEHKGQSAVFDSWNALLENDIPTKLLDLIEKKYSEDLACDLEDYFLYMEKRNLFYPVFLFWHRVFADAIEEDIAIEVVKDHKDDELNSVIKNYMEYCEELSDSIYSNDVVSQWDKSINSLCSIVTDEDDADFVNIDCVRELVCRYSFLDISYDFWIKIHEVLGDDITFLKSWVISAFGDETIPVVPAIIPDEDYDE